MIRHSRGMRTSTGGLDFLVVLTTHSEALGEVMTNFKDEQWPCQTAYSMRKSSNKGNCCTCMHACLLALTTVDLPQPKPSSHDNCTQQCMCTVVE